MLFLGHEMVLGVAMGITQLERIHYQRGHEKLHAICHGKLKKKLYEREKDKCLKADAMD